MDEKRVCYCGGRFSPATLEFEFEGFTYLIPGYLCGTCGERIMEAKVSEMIQPGKRPPFPVRSLMKSDLTVA